MHRNTSLTVLAAVTVVAGLLLFATPVFAHRAKPAAPAPHARYQPLPRTRPTQTSHWVHGSGKHRERIERKEHPARGVVRAKGPSRKRALAVVSRRAERPRKPVRVAKVPVAVRGLPRIGSLPKAGGLPASGGLAGAGGLPGDASRDQVAASVPVVSVIRQDAVHPQLEGIEEAATRTEILPDLYDERGRLNRMPALKGSHEILVRQNQMADLDGLTRVSDDDDLARMRETKVLVPLPVNSGLRVDERLEWNRRYCRPWVAQFLVAIGAAHYGEFHRPLQVNSAVRTVSFQLRLIRHNGNAAQAEGDAASPHLTGQAIDLAKKGLSEAEIAWMRLYLSRLVGAGLIDVEEEFKQACFHVSIYKRYAPPAPQQRIATTHRALTPALAEAME